jgi:regulator of sigma E protease
VGVTPEVEGQASPAVTAGLRPGDRFVRVDDQTVQSYRSFVDYIDAHAGQELELVVRRNGQVVTVRATPTEVREDGELVGRLGIIVGESLIGRDRSGPIEGIADAGGGFWRMFTGSFAMIGQAFGPEGIGRIGELLVGGEERRVDDPVGIVGAARVAGQAVQAGLAEAFLEMFAFFNVFVGILNLFPLPPLDGGHLAVLGIESATGRRLDQRRLIPVTALVVAFLLLFTISLLYLDVVRPIPNPFQ